MRLRKVDLGDIVHWDTKDWFVDSHSAKGTRLSPVLGGEPVWIHLDVIANHEDFEHFGAGDERGNVAAERIDLARLPKEARDDVVFWRDNLNEARFGVVNPSDPDAQPRDGYGEDTTIDGRFHKKAEELTVAMRPITVRALYKKDAKFRDEGILGLVNKAKFKTATGPVIPEKIRTAAAQVIAENLGASTRTAVKYLQMVKVRVAQDNPGAKIEWPSDRTLRRYLTPLLDEARLTATARERRSHSNRPKRAYRPVLATYPGQYVEIDANIADLMVLMPNGQEVRPHVTIAIDVYTRSIVGWHTHPAAPNAFDHQMLLIRAVMPRGIDEDADPSAWLANSRSLPGAAMIAMGQGLAESACRPYIAIESLTMDRGKDFLAARAAAEQLGITVIDAPPHSPVAKPHVEQFFNFMNKEFCAGFDSYVGHSTDHKGRTPGTVVPYALFVSKLERWITEVYQNRPHSGLSPLEHPGRSFSPNQMYAASFDASAGIPIPITANEYIGFLPHVERLIRADGIQIDNEIYDSEDLNGLRGTKTNHQVRNDPYDTDRVWVKHPDTGEWIECASRTVRLSTLPFGTTISAHLSAMPKTEDPTNQWGQDFLAAENKRVAQVQADAAKAKRATKKATKAAAEMANRKNDGMPRPGPVHAAPLPPVVPLRAHPDDYTVA